MRNRFILALSFAMFAVPTAARGEAQDRTPLPAPAAPCTMWSPPPPGTGNGFSFRFMDYTSHVESLQELVDGAPVIVEALAQTTSPGLVHSNPLGTETDVFLSVVEVLKGSGPLQELAVSRLGAGGLFEMQPGQRFILFLQDESPRRLAMMPNLQVPRFAVTGDTSGLFCIDNGKITLQGGSGLQSRYAGVSKDQAVADIRTHLQKARLAAQIDIEGGAFPPVGSPGSHGRLFRDRRADLKVVFKPAGANAAGKPARTSVAMEVFPIEPNAPGAPDVQWIPIDSSGAFTVPLDKGDYTVVVEGIPFGYYLKSISHGNADLTKQLLTVNGPASEKLQITLTTKAPDGAPAGARVTGQLTGIPQALRVPNSAGIAPFNDVIVTMISEGNESGHVGTARPARDGAFEFHNVPPGSYTLTAVTPSAPPGHNWHGQSSKAIVVTGSDMNLELPSIRGTEIVVRIVDTNGVAPASMRGVLLRFEAKSGELITHDIFPMGCFDECGKGLGLSGTTGGLLRIWLPPGEYALKGSVTTDNGGAVPRSITSGSVDLGSNPLRVDGITPVPEIVVIVD